MRVALSRKIRHLIGLDAVPTRLKISNDRCVDLFGLGDAVAVEASPQQGCDRAPSVPFESRELSEIGLNVESDGSPSQFVSLSPFFEFGYAGSGLGSGVSVEISSL